MAADNTETAKAWALSKSAFQAENNGKFEEALALHTSAIVALEKETHDGKILRTDAVRKAKLQIKVHEARRDTLRVSHMNKTVAPFVVPSLSGAEAQMSKYVSRGKKDIGTDQVVLYRCTKGFQPSADFNHLFQKPVPFYTTLLDPQLPVKSYYIYALNEITQRNGGFWKYLEAREKSRPGGQALYHMEGLLRKGLQTAIASLYRASDLLNPCVNVRIEGLKGKPAYSRVVENGRPMYISTGMGEIKESPDRVDRKGWTPRRFVYGGRRFVWKQETRMGAHHICEEELWEVEKEWPKPGSKTGKMEEKITGTKLVWHDKVSLFTPYYVIHLVGGMDQLFEEYLLASQMARMIVSYQNQWS